mmetsp:Transcript_36449/g.53475  ORF Transcript_36449/g.53475 Transcript_36449/m.53475 type:complete len:135 (-) Transcript_36449:358-762(-)
MGLEHDAPPHSHMEVPFTYELEAGCVGPSADGAQTNDPDFGAQGFDEDAWFEAQAERLRQRNQQQSMELDKIRLAVLPNAYIDGNAHVEEAWQHDTAVFDVPFQIIQPMSQMMAPNIDSTVDSFFRASSSELFA